MGMLTETTAAGIAQAGHEQTDAVVLPCHLLHRTLEGLQTYSAASRGPPSEGQQHSQNGPGQPENAPSDTRPDNPPAEDHSNQNAAPQSHNIATVIDVAAVSSVVGANQPMTEDAAAQEAADVAPAEQAITSKAEPGTQLGSQGPLTHLQQKLLLYTCPLA
ncbi:TPA: hypothetical protein ACH3X1_003701 [Trebouxia sp. C0004]